ncbi:MAG: hypothetical protein II892_04125 [Fibrobacter sp.]|nr:hypothetical protein [Fibrobacter sp.]
MKHLIKRTLLFTIPLVFSACIFDSDDDVEPWEAEKVCPAEGTNIYGMPNRGSFTDERDGQTYKYTTIGNQVWMAENLRYDAPYSTCSSDTSFIRQYCELVEHNCETMQCCKESLCHNFGRYYSIIENGNRFGLIDSVLADTICPKGWHIPTKEEWKILENAMKASDDNNSDVANRMKSADTIFFSISKLYPNEHDRTLAGTDNCALSILPSGFMYEGGRTLIFNASILSSTQKNSDFVYVVVMGNTVEYISNVYRNSIRCVMD